MCHTSQCIKLSLGVAFPNWCQTRHLRFFIISLFNVNGVKKTRRVFCIHTNMGWENNINEVFFSLPSYASCFCLSIFLPTLKCINMGNIELIGCHTSMVEIRLLLSTTCSGIIPGSFPSSLVFFSLNLIKAPQNYLRKQTL